MGKVFPSGVSKKGHKFSASKPWICKTFSHHNFPILKNKENK